MQNTVLPTRQVSPEFILRVLVDEHRQQSQIDPEADPAAILTFYSTIEEWRIACDLVDWRALAHALNVQWAIDATDEEWQAVLEPPTERTVGDVCRFLSERARLPHLISAGALGGKCLAAGAFLGIRATLHAAGLDVTNLRPYSDLEPYLRLAPLVFTNFAARIAPGHLPAIRIETPVYDCAVTVCAFSFFGLPIAGVCSFWTVAIALAVIFGCAWIAINLAARFALPKRASLEPLRTFRDSSLCIALRDH